MNGTVIFPSPNWFQVFGVAVSKDGWIIYGGPSKSLCVLEPLKSGNGTAQENHCYEAHIVNRAHLEKIVSVDISREWPEKKYFLTGSTDGSVKQWSLEYVQNATRIKSTHCLDIHQNEKEGVAGIGYSSESFAITVGTFGNIVKWDLKSNVAKKYDKFLKKFKPTCITCSYHIPLNVAVGTKQGVVFVVDLTGQGKIVYKVRAQDDDIVSMSWCPQYEVLVRKSLKESIKKSSAMERLEKIRSEPDDADLSNSAISTNLPDDSFDESIVQEDDTFDIYKDHEPDEFGHKKFEPKEVIVRVKEENKTDDFLAECLKLKEDILKMKNEPEPSIDNLVEALDKTHVESDSADNSRSPSPDNNKALADSVGESSAHIHKHLLATIGKLGGVSLWSKSGKLVGSCTVPNSQNKNARSKGPSSTTLLWYKPDVLLIADGKSQLLECNPLIINCKNKTEWRILHTLHKRGLYCVATNAPRLQLPDQTSASSPSNSGDCTPDQWKIWTIAQDRNIICYSLDKREKVIVHNTCGGFLYNVQSCPYDAKRIAVSVGDGAVRVWETDTLEGDDSKLTLGHVTTYWQNVQGKVLTVAWHPTRENLLAFATAESRVGLIDANKKTERPAKTLVSVLRGAIYSLCWGEGYDLYVTGGGHLVMYRTDKPGEDPLPINIEFEGQKWELSSATWFPTGLLCGSNSGAVAVLHPSTQKLITVAFVFSKMIHSMEWHPRQISSSNKESPYKDLIAISSLDRSCDIAIMEYADKGDGIKLHKWKTLSGHKLAVLQLVWNPHNDVQLLSTSHDSTIRVWDVLESVCTAIYSGHIQSSLGATWSAFPQLSSTVISGGADCCLRVWRVEDYPPEAHKDIKHEIAPRREKKKNKAKTEDKTEDNKEEEKEIVDDARHVGLIAATFDKFRVPKLFLLPTMMKQMTYSKQNLKKMADKFSTSKNSEINHQVIKLEDTEVFPDIKPESHTNGVTKSKPNETNGGTESKEMETTSKNDETESNDEEFETDANEVGDHENADLNFLNIFGNTNEFNEVLDLEMQRHIEQERMESWIMLSIFRGHIDSMIQFASQRDALCPFLVSISPCVSFKYWKDVTQLYMAQIERLVAKKEEYKIVECKWYGGAIYRRVALLLSVHDVKGAVAELLGARLFKEAYVLAKARHVDSIARETLCAWAEYCIRTGRIDVAAVCYMALGDPHKAAMSLAKSNKQEFLSVAAQLAKVAGQPTFATHIEDKKLLIISETPETEAVEELKPLPSKIDIFKDNIEIVDESGSDI